MKILLIFLGVIATSVADNVAIQEITNSINVFSSSLYKTVYKSTSKNFILGPFATETCLGFLQSGCKNPSSEELRRVLHLPNNQKISKGFRALLRSLTGNGFYVLDVISKIYVKNSFIIRKKFIKNGKQNFNAKAEEIYFNTKKKAAKIMNKYFERNTNKKIKNIIEPGALNSSTGVVLLNAFYFRANWSTPFSQALTKKNDFYKNLQETVSADFMFQNGVYNFCNNLELGAKFLEMSFKGKDASLVMVLPYEKNGLQNLETQLEKVLEAQQCAMEKVSVMVPIFKIESRLHLKTVLQAMGVRTIFDKTQADLSLIAGKRGALVVSEMLQKISFRVSEGGVEVSSSAGGSSDPDGTTTKQFFANHPFLFYLKIKNVIACVGRVLDPTQ